MNRGTNHLESLLTEAEGSALSDKELRTFRRMATLLGAWRVVGDRVDFTALRGEISARIADESLRGVDQLLQAASPPLPNVDWTGLSSRISAAIQREARALTPAAQDRPARSNRFAWVVGFGAPLAAAAVIAFVMWGARSNSHVATGPKAPKSAVFVGIEEPGSFGKVSITFDEGRPANAIDPAYSHEGSGIAVGPPHSETVDPPIDPAMIP